MTPTRQPASRPSLIEWAASSFVPPDETESGDMHLVREVRSGMLAALVDGLGHGAEAAAAARIAISTLLEAHAGEGIVALLRHCHQRLRVRGVR
jgi:negative regulator of sigma-B (phosphoserine phosphatase)